MTEQAFESPVVEQTFGFRGLDSLSLKNVRAEDASSGSLSSLKELARSHPLSPGKQPYEMSLTARLAFVDNTYSGTPFFATPISETTDECYWPANERPMSPGTDTSESSRSTAPSPPTTSCLLEEDDINESPRSVSDTSSEPARDTSANLLFLSPQSSRRPSQQNGCSPNRPVVHLNLSNNSLKSSAGSSPFRDGPTPKKYLRAKSEPVEVATENSNNADNSVVQRLAF